MSVKVTISNASKKRIVYHRHGCFYAKRIKYQNKLTITLNQALRGRNYCTCKYCSGLAGDLRMHKAQIEKWSCNLHLQFSYDSYKNRLYIRTENGFWKIIPTEDGWKYRLFHLNHFSSEASIDSMKKGLFHRQGDVAETSSLDQLVNYIHLHDDAKKIIAEDYHKLPRSTQKQKKYYKQAERRAHRNSWRRMDSIFDQIEAEMREKESRSTGVFIGQAL